MKKGYVILAIFCFIFVLPSYILGYFFGYTILSYRGTYLFAIIFPAFFIFLGCISLIVGLKTDKKVLKQSDNEKMNM